MIDSPALLWAETAWIKRKRLGFLRNLFKIVTIEIKKVLGTAEGAWEMEMTKIQNKWRRLIKNQIIYMNSMKMHK